MFVLAIRSGPCPAVLSLPFSKQWEVGARADRGSPCRPGLHTGSQGPRSASSQVKCRKPDFPTIPVPHSVRSEGLSGSHIPGGPDIQLGLSIAAAHASRGWFSNLPEGNDKPLPSESEGDLRNRGRGNLQHPPVPRPCEHQKGHITHVSGAAIGDDLI